MWDPQTYLAFADERTRPARDLLAAVDVDDPATVVDLGCGTGTSTRLLAERWPGAEMLGLDSSAEMIEAARAGTSEPRVRFEIGDAASWQAEEQVGVVFTNALLQWMPGHLDLMPEWLAALGPGGRLAVQVPANFEAPAHVLLSEICAAPRWHDRLVGLPGRHEFVYTAQCYLDRLAGHADRLDVWETTYFHRLTGPDPVLHWMSGTALRPVLDALATDAAARAGFLDEYGTALRAAYPPAADGTTTFPFRRLFLVAG